MLLRLMDLLPHCNFRHCSVREKEIASCIVEQLTETKVITSLSVAADKVSSSSSCNETECLCYILPIMTNLWNIKSTYNSMEVCYGRRLHGTDHTIISNW